MKVSVRALTLLVDPAYKKYEIRCWRGYPSGVKCKWCAYGPADATATPSSHLLKIQKGLPFWCRLIRVFCKRGRSMGVRVYVSEGMVSCSVLTSAHAGVANVQDRVISGSCNFVCVCPCSKRKMVELSKPNLVLYSNRLTYNWPRGQKGQGRTVMKTVVSCGCCGHCATAASMGLHFIWLLRFLLHRLIDWTRVLQPTRYNMSYFRDAFSRHNLFANTKKY